MNLADFERRAKELIEQADKVLATQQQSSFGSYWVDNEAFSQLRASGLSFLRTAFGESHPFFREFNEKAKDSDPTDTRVAKGILQAARAEVSGGWAVTTTGIISAEIFGDFLEMAEHLLDTGYKDPAAVMAGSVLEEHLRQLATKWSVPTEFPKDGKLLPKKADTLNGDLVKASTYNGLTQKSITMWLDLRNKAAHGNYTEYTREQVALMLQGIRDFIVRNPL